MTGVQVRLVFVLEMVCKVDCFHFGFVSSGRKVPFSTVIGIDCCDTVMRLLVDTEPFVFIGYRTHYPDQSRNCVYERMADNDLTNGEMSTSPLHRLVLMRPESANKLRQLSINHFNTRFRLDLEHCPVIQVIST